MHHLTYACRTRNDTSIHSKVTLMTSEKVCEKRTSNITFMSYVRARHPNFQPGNISIQESLRENQKESHRRLLKDTMGI